MLGNLVLVGLDYDFVGEVADELAEKMDKFFLDVNKLVEYSLIDVEKVKIICGIDYFEKEKRKVVKTIKNYENTIINFPYDYLINEDYKETFKNSYIIFIDLSIDTLSKLNMLKDNDNNLNIELIVNEELTKLISKNVNLVVQNNTGLVKDCVKDIEYQLKKLGLWG